MQAQDDAIHAVRDARNTLEAFVLSTRSARDGKHGSLIKAEETAKLLDAAEDWLYSDEAEAATDAGIYTAYHQKLEATTDVNSRCEGLCTQASTHPS